jgi:hypothetical protein
MTTKDEDERVFCYVLYLREEQTKSLSSFSKLICCGCCDDKVGAALFERFVFTQRAKLSKSAGVFPKSH